MDQMKAVMPQLIHMPVGWKRWSGTGVYTAAEVKAMDSCRTNPSCVPGLLFSALNGYQTEDGKSVSFTADAFDSPQLARKMYDARIKGWEKAADPSMTMSPMALPALGDAASGWWWTSAEKPEWAKCRVVALVATVVVNVSCSASEGRPDPQLPIEMARLIVNLTQQALRS
ncbi:hypothetical protein ACFT25_05880 [Streptomyces hydrogenans]|uniref:hypothetical protein n=1 Tax=Streptomyces hydrogenans TaxID=1873719 RepID=UPI003630B23B